MPPGPSFRDLIFGNGSFSTQCWLGIFALGTIAVILAVRRRPSAESADLAFGLLRVAVNLISLLIMAGYMSAYPHGFETKYQRLVAFVISTLGRNADWILIAVGWLALCGSTIAVRMRRWPRITSLGGIAIPLLVIDHLFVAITCLTVLSWR